jgi:hypothetical protein
VGSLSEAAEMETNGHWSEAPNRLDPHLPQKPRLLCFEDWNHLKAPLVVITRCSFLAAVTVKRPPEKRRQFLQWHAMTVGRSGPTTVYRTEPQRQRPDLRPLRLIMG